MTPTGPLGRLDLPVHTSLKQPWQDPLVNTRASVGNMLSQAPGSSNVVPHQHIRKPPKTMFYLPSKKAAAGSAGYKDPLWHMVRAYRRFWRRLTPALVDCVDIDSQITEIEGVARQLEANYKHNASRRWRDWISSSLQDGGQKVYRWIKKVETLGQGDQVESPSVQLERITKEWRSIWAHSTVAAQFSADAEAWPDEPIDQTLIARACKTFPRHTAVGVDGVRPRHILLLPEQAREILAVILNFAEAAGLPPVMGANVVFLPKPTGGERPIGILPTIYRVWCRCRRPLAHAWELQHSREYFWASAGRSSSQAVHLQGVRLEAARAEGHSAVALPTDLAKAYEYVNHGKLIQFAQATGFPTGLLRMSIATYGGARRIMCHGLCSSWFEVPGQTIVAGCGMATVLLKVYTLKLFDALRR